MVEKELLAIIDKLRLEVQKLHAEKTLIEPGQENDCYHHALHGEPKFTLLARDPLFFKYVKMWAEDRQQAVYCGDRPMTDLNKVAAAEKLALSGQNWRRKNYGQWRGEITTQAKEPYPDDER